VDPAPLDWLFALAQFGIKFGLDNIHAIVAELGHPERQFRSVHVAGTNGKGSVTAMVETALRHAGYRTGRYTSPHLLDLSERFAIDGEPVSQESLLSATVVVRDAVERLRTRGTLEVHPTFFEVTTAMAFELYRQHGVQEAVCEVGLGGRLDATNVLLPMACAITSIGLDHEQYLGTTLAAIAAEKAGIIKSGVPVVVGPVDATAWGPIAEQAARLGAPLTSAVDHTAVRCTRIDADGRQTLTLRTPVRDYGTLHLALAGRHQVSNAVVAVRLLETLESGGLTIGAGAIAEALATVRWPGRMEHVHLADSRDVLLDAAHNEDGAAALAQYLSQVPHRPMVFAAMRDKNARAMLRQLLPHVSRLVITRASNPRSAEPAELAALARALDPSVPVETAESPSAALAVALADQPACVVAGSIFLLADVMKALGRS